ncbi:MAG: ImmA/IrrE family metallo-endopeptidase, partial [Angustibacter sp.]
EAVGLDPIESDLASVIEQAFGIDVAIADLGPGFDGLSAVGEDMRLIIVSASSTPWRQRFTLAHELCHVLVGDDQGIHLDEDIYAPASRQGERRANAFAASFLMPEQRVRADGGPTAITKEVFAKLACELRVSPRALAYRLVNLGLIDGDSLTTLQSMTAQEAARVAQMGDRLVQDMARVGCYRPPALLAAAAYQAYEAGEVTLRLYASVVNADVEVLRHQLEAVDEMPVPT